MSDEQERIWKEAMPSIPRYYAAVRGTEEDHEMPR